MSFYTSDMNHKYTDNQIEEWQQLSSAVHEVEAAGAIAPLPDFDAAIRSHIARA